MRFTIINKLTRVVRILNRGSENIKYSNIVHYPGGILTLPWWHFATTLVKFFHYPGEIFSLPINQYSN